MDLPAARKFIHELSGKGKRKGQREEELSKVKPGGVGGGDGPGRDSM